jgi:hypothetical protein
MVLYKSVIIRLCKELNKIIDTFIINKNIYNRISKYWNEKSKMNIYLTNCTINNFNE